MVAALKIRPAEQGLFHQSDPVLGPALQRGGARQILHGGMWPSQRLWWNLPNYVKLFVGGYGCIHGNAEIRVNRGGKGFRVKLRDLVDRFNGRGRYAWDPEIPTYVQRREADGTIRLGRLRDAWCSGVKETFTVRTASWSTRATTDHPFCCEDGWKKLGDLRPGDRVYVFDSERRCGVAPKKVYVHRKAGQHPYRKPTGVVAEHRMVWEADLNGLAYDEFLRRLKAGELGGLEFLDPSKIVVHHKNHDHRDNRLENLEACSHREHRAMHAEENAVNVLFKSRLETIESIDLCGDEMTFDLELDDEPHNFIADGFVVHNSGKTIALCKRFIWLALLNGADMKARKLIPRRREPQWHDYYEEMVKPVPVAMVSPTYAMARETVLITLESLLMSMQAWCNHWRYQGTDERWLGYSLKRTSPYEITIWFKRKRHRPRVGRILIYSGEHPEKLKGPNLAAAGIDEPFIQDQEVFEQMHVRCRHPRAVLREVDLTGTPEQLNWGYDLAEGDLSTKHDVGLVQASTLENQALPQDYLENLQEAFDPKVAQAYLHGLFVNLSEGRVYYSFDREENVVELLMPDDAQMFAGMDFNVNPMAAVVGWFIERGRDRHIHFLDEIELPNSDTEEMCAKLREVYGTTGWINPICEPKEVYNIKRPLTTVYPDSNAGRSTSSPGGKTDYDWISDAGFEVEYRRMGNPLRRDRFNAVNGMLRPTGGRVRMTFSPRCKKLIKYQMVYSHELMNKTNQKAMSHLLDARDYPVCRLFPVERETLKLTKVRGT